MVNGIEMFRDFFRGYENQFVIIGGVAFRHWLTEIGENPRTTSDIDLVILTNEFTPKFIKRFAEFIKVGGYQVKSRSDGNTRNYRFTKPQPGYPKQIELLTSRDLNLPYHQIASHHVTETEEVFSAIMLDKPYYDILKDNYSTFDGLSYVDKDVLILLKMKAWTNFRRDFKEGLFVKPIDLIKHREDVITLLGTLSGKSKLNLEKEIIDNVKKFVEELIEFNIVEKLYSVVYIEELESVIFSYFLIK